MSKSGSALQTVAAVLLAAVPAGAQDFGAPPTPMVAIKRACDAAGGLDAFRKLGVVELKVAREEVTQDGHVSDSNKSLFFEAPGPTPARTEDPEIKVIAGDDGTAGWALVGDRPDARPSTLYMVKRLITSELFPILLPFSLTWDGVTVAEVSAADAGGQAVWRLKVQLAPTFFHTPQISTTWSVDLDRRTFALVAAESPATDLGKGMKADGMRFTWREPGNVKGVRLRGYQRVVGLDEFGREKAHSRIDHITYKPRPRGDAEKLFVNPIPPNQRPKVPAQQQPGAKPGA